MRIIVCLLTAVLFCYNSFAGEKVFQFSTINSLLNGNYNGSFSLDELKKYGDFGIGTYQNLDGEMIILDGIFYQIKSDGKIYKPEMTFKTPFAVVTNFTQDIAFKTEDAVSDLRSLTKLIDGKIPTINIIFAVRIEAECSYIKVRSVPAQEKPFKPLVEITKNQPIFEYKNIKGILAGFRFPAYAENINVPEYHLHFISADRTVGGHVLEIKLKNAVVQLSEAHNFELSLPKTEEFYKSNISGNNKNDVNKAEK